MKFAAIALVGTVAATTKASTACITSVGVYSDEKCKTAIDTTKDKKAKAVVDGYVKVFKPLCKDGKSTMTAAQQKTMPADKCTKLAAAVGKIKSVMYHTKKAGAQFMAVGAAA